MGLRTVFPKSAGFKETHWPGRPLVHHGPLSRFDRLARALELSGPRALFDATARADIPLWVEREGEPFQPAGPSPGAAADPYANGATFTCFRVESFVPAVKDLLYNIKCDLDLPLVTPTCHAYISGRGARIRTHFDRQENLVIQLSGQKRWQLAENKTVAFPHENHALGRPPGPGLERLSLKWPATIPKPARTFVMRPGSSLFLPRGMWHSTTTVAPSLSLTLIFPVANWAQTLTGRLLERLLMDARFREPASTSPGALAARSEDFVRAARAICDEGEGRYVLAQRPRPRLRGGRLEANGLSIAPESRYVPFLRWILSRKGSFAVTDAPPLCESAVEAAGIVSFLEEHGVLRRATPVGR